MAIELLSNTLLHAFRALDAGHIEIQPEQVSRSRARLTVENNGRGQSVPIPQRCQRIGHDLANLPKAEIAHGMPEFDGTGAQTEFLI